MEGCDDDRKMTRLRQYQRLAEPLLPQTIPRHLSECLPSQQCLAQAVVYLYLYLTLARCCCSYELYSVIASAVQAAASLLFCRDYADCPAIGASQPSCLRFSR